MESASVSMDNWELAALKDLLDILVRRCGQAGYGFDEFLYLTNHWPVNLGECDCCGKINQVIFDGEAYGCVWGCAIPKTGEAE